MGQHVFLDRVAAFRIDEDIEATGRLDVVEDSVDESSRFPAASVGADEQMHRLGFYRNGNRSVKGNAVLDYRSSE